MNIQFYFSVQESRTKYYMTAAVWNGEDKGVSSAINAWGRYSEERDMPSTSQVQRSAFSSSEEARNAALYKIKKKQSEKKKV